MKLLGWMNRKTRQNNLEPPQKEFLHGISTKPSLYMQEQYLKQTFAPEKPRQQDTRLHEVENSYFIHDGSFDGFLTIGTLGLDPSSTDPPTPTFAMPPEKIREEAIDAGRVELQLVNNELIKFLEEEKKERCVEMKESENMTCKRNICTMNKEENRDMVTLPLQGYLFASSIDLPDTSVYMKKEKVSLRQLFEASNAACGHSTKKGREKEKNDMSSYTKPFLKKIMNKLHSSSRSSTTYADDKPAVAPQSIKRKLSKVGYQLLPPGFLISYPWNDGFQFLVALMVTKRENHSFRSMFQGGPCYAFRLFNRKVHPERTGEEKKTETYNKDNAKSSVHKFQINRTYNFPVKPMLKSKFSGLELETHKALHNEDSTQNKEYWIRTDADYVVLEL
ncbi:protein LAZY 1-like [Impatiens glandulifera]|uniref:protein LAZY 1-like n=1 Tax=Impatiens glandulifera TaxID=253017 RepID=UPI001FB19A07|nr:protein LAZY 1-like [Impatiens glandulifera]